MTRDGRRIGHPGRCAARCAEHPSDAEPVTIHPSHPTSYRLRVETLDNVNSRSHCPAMRRLVACARFVATLVGNAIRETVSALSSGRPPGLDWPDAWVVRADAEPNTQRWRIVVAYRSGPTEPVRTVDCYDVICVEHEPDRLSPARLFAFVGAGRAGDYADTVPGALRAFAMDVACSAEA